MTFAAVLPFFVFVSARRLPFFVAGRRLDRLLLTSAGPHISLLSVVLPDRKLTIVIASDVNNFTPDRYLVERSGAATCLRVRLKISFLNFLQQIHWLIQRAAALFATWRLAELAVRTRANAPASACLKQNLICKVSAVISSDGW